MLVIQDRLRSLPDSQPGTKSELLEMLAIGKRIEEKTLEKLRKRFEEE